MTAVLPALAVIFARGPPQYPAAWTTPCSGVPVPGADERPFRHAALATTLWMNLLLGVILVATSRDGRWRPVASPPRLRWYQFSLRSLLIAVTLSPAYLLVVRGEDGRGNETEGGGASDS